VRMPKRSRSNYLRKLLCEIFSGDVDIGREWIIDENEATTIVEGTRYVRLGRFVVAERLDRYHSLMLYCYKSDGNLKLVGFVVDDERYVDAEELKEFCRGRGG